MHVNFLYNFWEFLQFFPELSDTRGPLGGPQGGYPTWVPLSNNLNILRFWNILEWLVGHNKPKKRDQPSLGGPQSYAPPQNTPPIELGPPQGLVGPIFLLIMSN